MEQSARRHEAGTNGVVSRDWRYEEIVRVADARSNLSLAAQVVLQAEQLLLLERLAFAGKTKKVVELLTNPVAMSAAHAAEVGRLTDERELDELVAMDTPY